jgi:hypothetical protein
VHGTAARAAHLPLPWRASTRGRGKVSPKKTASGQDARRHGEAVKIVVVEFDIAVGHGQGVQFRSAPHCEFILGIRNANGC